jgi:hypothetical protein
MVRLGVLAVTMAALFGATASGAQRTRKPVPQQDAAPPVYVDASEIVRDAAERADRNGGYGTVDDPPVVVMPPVVSRGGVTSYATNGAYLGGARRYKAGGSSVVTVQSGASYGYPEAVAAPRYRKRARARRR